jgi:hypothetical protein
VAAVSPIFKTGHRAGAHQHSWGCLVDLWHVPKGVLRVAPAGEGAAIAGCLLQHSHNQLCCCFSLLPLLLLLLLLHQGYLPLTGWC